MLGYATRFEQGKKYRCNDSKTVYEAVFADYTGAALKYHNAAGELKGIFIEHTNGFGGWTEVEDIQNILEEFRGAFQSHDIVLLRRLLLKAHNTIVTMLPESGN